LRDIPLCRAWCCCPHWNDPKTCLAIVLSVLSDGSRHLFVLVHRNLITPRQIFPFQWLKREFGLLSCMSVVIYTLLFVLFFIFEVFLTCNSGIFVFYRVSWPKSEVGDFDSLSTLLRNKEFWSFSSSHQTLVAFRRYISKRILAPVCV